MKRLFVLATLTVFALNARADDLESGFVNPPDSTRPRCYWYWLDGHISKDGITKDLEAMKRVGIGEGYIGMIEFQSGAKANPDLKPLTDPWWEMMVHAIREGTRLGVDVGVFNSPGWSQSGGPWVKPEQAMRYVSLPEVRVHGPQHYEAKLPSADGSFQDVAVMAFPAPEGEEFIPVKEVRTPRSIDIEFTQAITARSITIQPAGKVNVAAELFVSADGKAFQSVKKFEIDRHNLDVNVGPVPLAAVVATFSATPGRFFRISFSRDCTMGDIRVSPAARVEDYMEKQLAKVFQNPLPPYDFYTFPAAPEPDQAELMVKPDAVQNISENMSPDGTLRWDVPAGDWIILRAGLRPTGSTNSPAAPAATGLEVDKMNKKHLAAHFDAYVGELIRRVPEADRKSFKHVVADSYERGPQNWTDGFADDFKRVYGYDPLPFLPVMSGRIVGSADQSDRFLWDLRRLIADRVASDYVGGLRELCAPYGLKMWLENYGHFGFPSEFLAYGGACDEIAGEFWCSGSLGSIELRDASSAAHTYGKNAVWAEAWTGGPLFVNSPRDLKARGDWAMCQGINQFVLHVYIQQPDDVVPGMSARFGSEFNRHNTWFEMSKSWIDYHRRCTHLLQQGLQVADVAYFIGEDSPKMTGIRQPAMPSGYDFDYINAQVLINRATVKNHRLTLPDGMSYGLLVLPPGETMRPELLTKIASFVEQGLPVIGPLPTRSPSLQNFPTADAEVKRIATALKDKVPNDSDVPAALKLSPDVADLPPKILFTHRRSDNADIYFLSNQADTSVSFAPPFRVSDRPCELWHPDTGEIERIATEPVGTATRVKVKLEPHGSIFVVFRTASTHPLPSLAAAGGNLKIVKATYEAIDHAGAADVTAELTKQIDSGSLSSTVSNKALGSDPASNHVKQLRVDYTFNDKPKSVTFSEGQSFTLPVGDPIPGPWQVKFGDQSITLDTLTSWTNRPEHKIKYFSGTASYHVKITATDLHPRVMLNLGQVDSVAEVSVNGHTFPALWKSPYQLDIASAIKAGENQLEIKVANVWHNRLVGQTREAAALGAPVHASFTPRYGPDEPLMSSGLIGPVTINGAEVK